MGEKMDFQSNILNHMAIGAVKCRNDCHSTIVYSNLCFHQFIGYTSEQLKAEHQNHFFDLMYADTRNIFLTKPLLKKEKSMKTELHLRKRDNTELWLYGEIYLRADNFVYASFMDITNQKKVFLEMEYELMRYRALEETARDILFHYDIASDAMTYTYKTKTKHYNNFTINSFLRSKKYKKYIHPDYWDIYFNTLQKACDTQLKGSFEYCTKIIESEYTWYQITYCSQWCPDYGNRSIVGRLTNIHQLVLDRISTSEKVNIDAMTGLYHKIAAQEKIIHYMESVSQDVSALLVIDLDNFKTINDTFGHAMGDHVLKYVAKLLQRVFSNDDIIGRFGGDEFIVLMKKVTPAQVKRKIRQYKKLLAEAKFEMPFLISSSIGVSFSDTCKNNYSLLFKRADAAMYRAKHMGKNKYFFHDDHSAIT